MFLKNTIITYPVLLIMSIKKSFEALGEKIGKTGKTISRWLYPATKYYDILTNLCLKEFGTKKELILIFDETLIRKIYSQLIEGSGRFYDMQLFRRIMAFKLIVAMLTDGKQALPLISKLLFSKELVPNQKATKFEWIKTIIITCKKLFPKVHLIVVADGAFANKEFLKWCKENNIAIEVRMRSNCVVTYKNEKVKIRDIKSLIPKGRQKARIIKVIWHDIQLFITAHKRTDKNEKETIVFQASTFKAKPIRHVQIYQLRWNIEKMFRTAKQHLGLQECFARKMETQESHIAAVFLAYAFLQYNRKKSNLPTPEASLRAFEHKKGILLNRHIDRLNRFIDAIYV
jgi:hypothetical protein